MSASPDTRPGAHGQQAPNVAVLEGVLERVTFCNPETGHTIARIAPDRGTGRPFEVWSYSTVLPATE